MLPFKALVRQALPSIDPSPAVSLDGRAGGVMLGASGRTTVTINNAGVLAMQYSVKVGWDVLGHWLKVGAGERNVAPLEAPVRHA